MRDEQDINWIRVWCESAEIIYEAVVQISQCHSGLHNLFPDVIPTWRPECTRNLGMLWNWDCFKVPSEIFHVVCTAEPLSLSLAPLRLARLPLSGWRSSQDKFQWLVVWLVTTPLQLGCDGGATKTNFSEWRCDLVCWVTAHSSSVMTEAHWAKFCTTWFGGLLKRGNPGKTAPFDPSPLGGSVPVNGKQHVYICRCHWPASLNFRIALYRFQF